MLTFISSFFFFNDTATTEIYTLSLHDALPISDGVVVASTSYSYRVRATDAAGNLGPYSNILSVTTPTGPVIRGRSEEHTSELQSHLNLVCRLLLEKKKECITVVTICQMI